MKTLATKSKHPATQVRKPRLRTTAPAHLAQNLELREIRNILSRPALQCKLRIVAVGDKYEQEADRVAEQVISMPNPALQPDNSLDISALSRGDKEWVQTNPLPVKIKHFIQRRFEGDKKLRIQPANLSK